MGVTPAGAAPPRSASSMIATTTAHRCLSNQLAVDVVHVRNRRQWRHGSRTHRPRLDKSKKVAIGVVSHRELQVERPEKVTDLIRRALNTSIWTGSSLRLRLRSTGNRAGGFPLYRWWRSCVARTSSSASLGCPRPDPRSRSPAQAFFISDSVSRDNSKQQYARQVLVPVIFHWEARSAWAGAYGNTLSREIVRDSMLKNKRTVIALLATMHGLDLGADAASPLRDRLLAGAGPDCSQSLRRSRSRLTNCGASR